MSKTLKWTLMLLKSILMLSLVHTHTYIHTYSVYECMLNTESVVCMYKWGVSVCVYGRESRKTIIVVHVF